jgi:hypothetical protein
MMGPSPDEYLKATSKEFRLQHIEKLELFFEEPSALEKRLFSTSEFHSVLFQVLK